MLGSPMPPVAGARMLWENLLVCVGLPKRPGAAGPAVDDLGPGVAAESDGRAPLDPGAGVICRRRTGESGRGRDVRGGRRLPCCGLGARGIGPPLTDWLNLGREGVGGVKLVEFWLPSLRPVPLLLAAVGVMGKAEGEASRRTALLRGRKMPAPGMFVLK